MRKSGLNARNWVMQVGFLAMALALIVWLAFKLNEPGVSDSFAAFFGAEPAKRWCPDGVSSIQVIHSGQTLVHRAEVDRLCAVPMSSFASEQLENVRWQPYLRLESPDGEAVLEADLASGMFRLRDFPFSSEVLKANLEGLKGP